MLYILLTAQNVGNKERVLCLANPAYQILKALLNNASILAKQYSISLKNVTTQYFPLSIYVLLSWMF